MFANGARYAAFTSIVNEGAKRLQSGGGGSVTGGVTESDVRSAWAELRNAPEVSAIEERLGVDLTITVSMIGKTGYLNGNIHINLTTFSIGYETVLPPGWEGQFEHLTGDAYFDALDSYEASYPALYRFSPRRVLIHEAFHVFDGAPTGLKYEMNMRFYEQPVIDRTNEFMRRNYGEPYRLNHHRTRVMP